MKVLILILGCLLLVVPCQAAEKEFGDIEEYISRLRGDIEHYYRGQLIELKHRTESEIRLLDVAEKAAYSSGSSSSVIARALRINEAMEMTEKTMYSGLYISLDVQTEVAKAVLHVNNYGYQAPSYLDAKIERMLRLKGQRQSPIESKDRIKRSPERFVVAHSLITQRKNKILAKMEWEAIRLEEQKEYALNVALPALEKRLKEDALKPKPKATHGEVTGILYSKDRPSAILDSQVVHEGDTIHGVKLIKVYKDKVAFEKNGRKWEQQVRQIPEDYWK